MEKLAIIDLTTTEITLTLSHIVKGKSFVVYDEIKTPIDLRKDFYDDEVFKPVVVKEIVATLQAYKKIIEAQEVSNIITTATNFVKRAKNFNGFINEINSVLNSDFKVIEDEDEINFIYTSAINSFNKPKALVINIKEYVTQLLVYNRRNVLNTHIVPFGTVNLKEQFAKEELSSTNLAQKMQDFFAKEIEGLNFLSELEEEFDVIGFGQSFLSLGEISRRARRYPLNIAHNYVVNKENFKKVYDLIKPVEQSASSKVKGLSLNASQNLLAGLSIIAALYGKINKEEVAISAFCKLHGLTLNYVLPITTEKPISDNLGYSLQVLNEYYDTKFNNSEHIHSLGMIIFKQLKVLHKLNRSFVRVLRTASYLSVAGKRVDFYNSEKASFDIIVNSNIFGLTHSELVLAAFVALLRDPDNFNLPDWVKYRELVTEEDLDAVKKLAVILRVAEGLDVTRFGNVVDANCDILGDSVIMKTTVNAPSDLEIKHALLWSAEFKKAFGKNLEIL